MNFYIQSISNYKNFSYIFFHFILAKAMEVEEKPNDDYTDIGGLDKQI
jgi:hypothetical protein